MVLVGVSYARTENKSCHLLISYAYARQVWEEMEYDAQGQEEDGKVQANCNVLDSQAEQARA